MRSTTVHQLVLFALLAFLPAVSANAKPPYTKGETDPMMKEVSPYLIEKLVGRTGKSIADLSTEPAFRKLVRKHDLRILTGPMLGRMTGTSVGVWLRTPQPATVRIVAEAQDGSDDTVRSPSGKTTREKDLVTTIPVDGLTPETTYRYQVLVDGEPAYRDENRPSFRTYPAKGNAGTFRVIFGACSRYIPPNEDVWTKIRSYEPHAFLTLGDNVYIDTPKNFSKQRLHYYRRQMRPEYKQLTESTPVYAIWDDHDFGDNDSAGGVRPFQPSWKPKVWSIFRRNWNNPFYGGGEEYPGVWFDFHIGDVHFIMTDGRYYRDFEEGTMLGERQLNWLLETLGSSDATFKIIASSTMWTRHADKGGADSWWGVKNERNRIFDFIAERNVNGVVLISGDRHRAEVQKMEWNGDYPLWEFENGILTNKHHHRCRGTSVFCYSDRAGHLFGVFDIDTSADDPELTYRIITKSDETVYEKTLRLSVLSD